MTDLKKLTVRTKIIDAIIKKQSDLLLSVDEFEVLKECSVKDFLFVEEFDYDAELDFDLEVNEEGEDKYKLLAPVSIETVSFSDYEITKVDVIDKESSETVLTII